MFPPMTDWSDDDNDNDDDDVPAISIVSDADIRQGRALIEAEGALPDVMMLSDDVITRLGGTPSDYEEIAPGLRLVRFLPKP